MLTVMPIFHQGQMPLLVSPFLDIRFDATVS